MGEGQMGRLLASICCRRRAEAPAVFEPGFVEYNKHIHLNMRCGAQDLSVIYNANFGSIVFDEMSCWNLQEKYIR